MRARHVITAFSGARLRQLRRERGLSQEALGRILAALQQRRGGELGEEPLEEVLASATVTDAAVTRERLKVLGYESGAHQPRADALHALATALQTGAADLLDPQAPITLDLLRALQHLTQGEVAAQLGMSQARYSQLENGQGRLDEDRRATLAELLHVDPADLERLISGAVSS